MPKLSKASLAKLETCHSDLQRLVKAVVITHDCTVICGERTLEDQQKAYKGGFSKLDGIKKKSTHQTSKEQPKSLAVDVLPYPINWNDKEGHIKFARVVKYTADQLGIKIVWGGDWKFVDRPHYQLA